MQALHNDDSKPGRAVKAFRESSSWSKWAGFADQTPEDVFQTQTIREAIVAFRAASGKIETHLTPGAVNYSPVGASFSMGKFLTGHPVCAFKREKTKLPSKTINISVNCSAYKNHAALAAPLSRIIRAAWEYQNAGGLVTLTVNYIHQFSRPQIWNDTPHAGLITTIAIPLTNPGILATAASVQFYRGLSIPVAAHLSGSFGDGLPVTKWSGPGIYPLNGTASDSLALDALRIV